MSKEIFLCAINNILSGTCLEDCGFCTQSVRHHAQIERYDYKSTDQIIAEARQAKQNGALGYCLVTAGKGLDDKKTEFVARAARAVKDEVEGLNLIACNGIATREQLLYLKQHGIDSYNHNLETSERYYAKICTTHEWQERYATCENVKSSELKLCSGGIFGMGETMQDRDDLIAAFASLNPESSPLNFYIPNAALPIPKRTINREEALDVIRKARRALGDECLLMVAGGREQVFGGYEIEMFDAGANAIVIGDYLTVSGDAPESDREKIEKLGYTVAMECHAH